MHTAEREVEALRGKVDVLIAITHLSFDTDRALTEKFPEIDLIIGGHEHEKHLFLRGTSAPITKADANAKSAFIHYFAFDPITREFVHNPILRKLDSKIPEDPALKQATERWVKLAYDGFRKEGFNPDRVVATTTNSLDGTEASVRNKQTNLSQLIGDGMMQSAVGSVAAIYNAGSIRIDDTLAPGSLTEYDVIRILPFGGKALSVEMKGSLLSKVLTQGEANAGKGGYLQTRRLSKSADGSWKLGDALIDADKTYLIVMNDFLLTGKEENFDYLKPDNPDLKVLKENEDIRQTTISQLKVAYPR